MSGQVFLTWVCPWYLVKNGRGKVDSGEVIPLVPDVLSRMPSALHLTTFQDPNIGDRGEKAKEMRASQQLILAAAVVEVVGRQRCGAECR